MLEELKRHNALVQERIMKSFGYADTEDYIQKGEDEVELIQKGEIEYDWELEKAVYADTAQNRKLGRVGQEYNHKKSTKEKINLKIGRTVNYSSDTNEPYIISKINSDGTVDLKGKSSGFGVTGVPIDRLKPEEAKYIQKGEDEVELIQKGEIEYDWELEKAVYADTAQNRKLGRVGQEYHRGRKKNNMEGGNDGGNKPESNRQKGSRLRKEVRQFLKKTGTKLNTPEFYNKVKEIMERENVDSHIMSQAVGQLYEKSGEMAQAYRVIREMEPAGVREEKKRKKHEKFKKDVIKDILKNGAGQFDDRFLDNNKTDYYKSIMKEYGVSDVGELADKLGEEEGNKGYRKYSKIYTNMLKQIPPSVFYEKYGD